MRQPLHRPGAWISPILDESGMLYKLYNQQAKAGGGGIMPAIGTLSVDQQCLFYNWVVSGAN